MSLRCGSVQVSVAPGHGGRLTTLRWGDGPNRLWANPQADVSRPERQNIGGEKTWIGPIENWKAVTGSYWPPPCAFDHGPFAIADRSEHALTLLSPVETNWNLRVRRTIKIDDRGVEVLSSLVAGGGDPVPALRITNWTVAQIPPPLRFAARLTGRKGVDNGMRGSPAFPAPVMLDGAVRVFDLAGCPPSAKCGLDADVLVAEYPDGLLVMQHEAADGGTVSEHPDRAQVFCGVPETPRAEATGYVELEFASNWPESTHAVRYTFLPSRPADSPDARILSCLNSLP